MKNTKNTGMSSLAKELKVKRPKEQTPQEKGKTFDRYTKDLPDNEPVKENTVKVINEPGEVKKETIKSLRDSVNSYRGHNSRQRVEIAKLLDENKRLGSDIWALEVSLEDEKCFRVDVEKSLKTAEGIIAERDKTIENIQASESDIKKIEFWRLGLESEELKHEKTNHHKNILFAMSLTLAATLAATLVVNYGGF